MRGKIYKIRCHITNLTYYGSTTQKYLSNRLAHHKHYNKTMVRKMDIPKIYLVEELDFPSREKMLQRERWWIENNECINHKLPTRTRKEYYQANKEKIKEQEKEYREANKEKINERRCEKIECECGLFYTRQNKLRHLKSKRHNELIKKNNN